MQKKTQKTPPSVKTRRAPNQELQSLSRGKLYWAISFIGLAVFLLICLLSYDSGDPSFNSVTSRVHVANRCGLVGAHVADVLAQLLGTSAVVIPGLLIVLSLRLLLPVRRTLRWSDLLATILIIASLSALLERYRIWPLPTLMVEHPGGTLGIFLHGWFAKFVGPWGEILVACTITLVSALHICRLSWDRIRDWGCSVGSLTGRACVSAATKTTTGIRSLQERRREEIRQRLEAHEYYAESRNMEKDMESDLSAPVVAERFEVEPAPFHDEYELDTWRSVSDLPEEFDSGLGAMDQLPNGPELPEPSDVSPPAEGKLDPVKNRGAKTKERVPEPARIEPTQAAPDSEIETPKSHNISPCDSKGAPEHTVGPREMKAAIDAYLKELQDESSKDKRPTKKSPAQTSKPDRDNRPIEVARRADENMARSVNKKSVSKAEDDYQFPPIDLLDAPPPAGRSIDRSVMEENAATLEQKLSDLGIRGEVVAIHPGPVITMYELVLGKGIPLRKILTTADDLAMALKSGSTRIVAPIPGKDTVGIEVPNLDREIVYFREIVESEAFVESQTPLKMALGKEIDGEPFASSLARMPHLLIAGATGTGKSVGLNVLIGSWLMSCHPDELKFLLVDPKKLELSSYEGIPHLLHPVVTEAEKVPAVLGWAIREMERRYELLSKVGSKNIESYNEKVRKGEVVAGPDGEAHTKLPYIVIIIDELAELMMVAAKDIEISIARLAQMARAAGIHLILATQRPSVDVITGVIKANFPARISFQVSAKADSRTILDTVGAEHLLGRGDMLFLPPGTAKMRRLHGAYISEKEIESIVDFIKAQREPVYLQEIAKTVSASESKDSMAESIDDEKYDQAVELVCRLGHASISLIQRHMRIGYNRAARIIEAMEAEGLIGPSDGTSRPREVLARSLDHVPDR